MCVLCTSDDESNRYSMVIFNDVILDRKRDMHVSGFFWCVVLYMFVCACMWIWIYVVSAAPCSCISIGFSWIKHHQALLASTRNAVLRRLAIFRIYANNRVIFSLLSVDFNTIHSRFPIYVILSMCIFVCNLFFNRSRSTVSFEVFWHVNYHFVVYIESRPLRCSNVIHLQIYHFKCIYGSAHNKKICWRK